MLSPRTKEAFFNDTGVAATTISADFMTFVFVIDVIVFDVAVVFVIDVITDIIFDIKVIVIITFVVVDDFTVIITDIHLLAFVDIINVIVVIVAIVNGSIVDTGIVISVCSTTFFLFRYYQRPLLFLFLDRSIYSFRGVLMLLRFSKDYFFP